MSDIYIYGAVRTPRGRGKANKGALSGLHPQELFAQALNHLADKSGFDKAAVEDFLARGAEIQERANALETEILETVSQRME